MCGDILQDFCHDDFNDHRQNLSKQLEVYEITQTGFQQTAEETRQLLFKHVVSIEDNFINRQRQNHQQNDYSEPNISQRKHELSELAQELINSSNISKIATMVSSSKWTIYIHFLKRIVMCRQVLIVLVLDIDDDQTICIDSANDRIVEWKYNANNGQIVAGGNGQENRQQLLGIPADVIVDKKNDSLIICGRGNIRAVLWSYPNDTIRQIVIPSIDYWSLTMDKNGNIFMFLTLNDLYKKYF
jgi:hypothetical protein